MDNQLTLSLRVQDWPLVRPAPPLPSALHLRRCLTALSRAAGQAIATLHRMLGLRKSQDEVQVDLRIVEFLVRKLPALSVEEAAEAAERSQMGSADTEEVVEDEAPLPSGGVRPVGAGEPGTNAEADSDEEGPGGASEDPGEDPGEGPAAPSYQDQVREAAERAHSSLQRQLDGLVERITQELSSDPRVWRVVALLRRGRGQDKEAREAKLKEVRGALAPRPLAVPCPPPSHRAALPHRRAVPRRPAREVGEGRDGIRARGHRSVRVRRAVPRVRRPQGALRGQNVLVGHCAQV